MLKYLFLIIRQKLLLMWLSTEVILCDIQKSFLYFTADNNNTLISRRIVGIQYLVFVDSGALDQGNQSMLAWGYQQILESFSGEFGTSFKAADVVDTDVKVSKIGKTSLYR